jgi:tRNA-dihydrouridine synthase B
MSGVSDKPFRSAVKSFGAGLTVSEMVASNESIRQSMGAKKRILGTQGEDILDIQIVGSCPDLMADTAKWCMDNGADIVDINFGCPAKKVTGKMCGSAIMQDITLAQNIMQKVVSAVDIPVTVKMRTGWNDDNRNAPEIAKIAESCGIQMITVHGRTREQLYRGVADWGFVRNVKNSVNIPVIINGDIVSVDGAVNALAQSGADGVMIGRGAQGRPWFLSQVMSRLSSGVDVATPDIETQYATVKKQYLDMIDHYGEYKGVRHGRKHLSWYIEHFDNSNETRKNIMAQTCSQSVLSIVENFYTNLQKGYANEL